MTSEYCTTASKYCKQGLHPLVVVTTFAIVPRDALCEHAQDVRSVDRECRAVTCIVQTCEPRSIGCR